MALRLEVISAQRQQLGARASFVLGAAGARIGRALDNDWALPDVTRFLSGHHAIIHFRAGAYYLEDTSTNGVYLNDAVAPLGRNGVQAQLHAGDVVRMGEYRVLVHIEDEAPLRPLPPEPSAPPPERARPRHEARTRGTEDSIDFSALLPTDSTASVRRMGVPVARHATDGDLGDSLTIESLLPPDAADAAAKIEATAAWRVGSGAFRELDASLRGAAANAAPSDSTMAKQLGQERLDRLRAAAKTRLESTGSARVPQLQGPLEAFARGAGIDVERLATGDEAQTLYVVGRLLREALQGLIPILRAQQAFLAHNQIEYEAPEGPAPVDLGANEYLLELLNGHEKRRLDAVMRLREQFAHAGGHAAAIDPALRRALEQFLGYLTPERMEISSGAAASWNRYKEIHVRLVQATGGQLPHLFLEALAQAYLAARGSGPR